MHRKIIQEDLENIISLDLPWNEFSGKTFLISGANGFLPAYMVETLLYLNQQKSGRDKTKVIGIVRNREKSFARFAHYRGRSDLELRIQDVCAPLIISEEQIDYIIHAASQASPKYYGTDPVGTLSPNVMGTANLLNLARERNAEGFLFFSSGEVYGEVDASRIPTKEDCYGYVDPTSVRSCYAESKRMGETMCVSWYHQYNVPAKIIRPFHTYGPGMRLDDGRVYADFISDIVNDRDITMKSDGRAVRAFCYLADAVQGIFAVLTKGSAGQAYNIGNSAAEISIIELADKLVAMFPKKNLRVIRHEALPEDGYLRSQISRNCPDISKARTLGWEPKTTIEDGFRRTVRSFT